MTKPIGERTASLETSMENLDKKVDKGFEQISKEIGKLSSKIEEYHKENDNRFATKDDVKEVKDIAERRSWLMGGAGMLIGLFVSLVVSLIKDMFLKK